MIKFIDIEEGLPKRNREDIVYVVKCPDWNEEGYQVCSFNGTKFEYDGQPNDMFMDNVEAWAILFLDRF